MMGLKKGVGEVISPLTWMCLAGVMFWRFSIFFYNFVDNGFLKVKYIAYFQLVHCYRLSQSLQHLPFHLLTWTLIITLVYVQITLFWRYFTLEITLGSKKKSNFLLPSPTVRLNLISILSLADMKWKQYLPWLPLPASK